jgi:hypothetical protein
MNLMSYAKEVASVIIANQKVKPVEEVVVKSDDQVYNLRYNVTDVILEIYKKTDYLPWTSFDLTNNGPNPVYFCVNKWLSQEAPLPVGQSINVDLKRKNAINKIYLKCDRGLNANVYLYIRK